MFIEMRIHTDVHHEIHTTGYGIENNHHSFIGGTQKKSTRLKSTQKKLFVVYFIHVTLI